jgi:hypothetical protein
MIPVICYSFDMSKIQLGDLGTWLGSLGAIAAILYAYFRGSSEGRNSKERERREQAEKISSWVASEKRELPVKLSNSSGDPVYDVIVNVVLVQGAGPQTGKETFLRRTYKVLPPGQFIVIFNDYPGGGMHTKPGTEIAFTDKKGSHWLKDKNGALISLGKQSPTEYYEMGQPVEWMYLDND